MARTPKNFDLSGDARMIDLFARGVRPWAVAKELGSSERTMRRRRAELAPQVATRRAELAARLPTAPADGDEEGAGVPEAPRETIQKWIKTAQTIATDAQAKGDTATLLDMLRLAVVLLRRLVDLDGPSGAPAAAAIDWPAVQKRVRDRMTAAIGGLSTSEPS